MQNSHNNKLNCLRKRKVAIVCFFSNEVVWLERNAHCLCININHLFKLVSYAKLDKISLHLISVEILGETFGNHLSILTRKRICNATVGRDLPRKFYANPTNLVPLETWEHRTTQSHSGMTKEIRFFCCEGSNLYQFYMDQRSWRM